MFERIQNKARNLAIAAVATVSATPAFADNSAAIGSAISTATSDVSTVTAGVITVAALGFGLGMVVSWLRK